MLLLEQDIPEFVWPSSYLKSLLENESLPDEGIEVPTDCAKKNLTIDNESDFFHLLRTLRFWLLADCFEPPPSMLTFVFNPANKECVIRADAEYGCDFPSLRLFSRLLSGKDEDRLKKAVVARYSLKLVHFLYEDAEMHGCGVNKDDDILAAGSLGWLECARYLHSRGCRFSLLTNYVAAHNGNLEALKFLNEIGVAIRMETVQCAVLNGKVDCARYLLDRYSEPVTLDFVHNILVTAAMAGCLQCLEISWNKFEPVRHLQDEWTVLLQAALYGRPSILEFGRTNQFAAFQLPEHAATMVRFVVHGGHVCCLEYVYNLGLTATAQDLKHATFSGHTTAVQFLIAHDVPVQDDLCTLSATHNRLPLLQWLHDIGQPWDQRTCTAAATQGHLECLQFLHEHGCPWDDTQICIHAAQAPTVDCLRYVVEQGAALTVQAARAAAQSGQIANLEYLDSVGCVLER